MKGDLHILLISTLRGEQLYRSYSPHGTDTLVSLMGENFLATMDGSTLSSQGFFVPTASVRVVEEALQANVKVVAAALADGAPQYQSISLMRQSYESFQGTDEASSFIKAAKTLGHDMGVIGSDNAAAMSVYVMAMRLSKYSHRNNITAAYYPCDRGCAQCPVGSGCLGLCGASCTCWWWVCGDCCYHKGCYDHDICCSKTYFSLRCAFPATFTCNSYSC